MACLANDRALRERDTADWFFRCSSPREAWRELTESATGSHQRSPASVTSLGYESDRARFPACYMFKIVINQGLLTLAGPSAARRVNPWTRFPTHHRTLVVMLGDEDPEVPAENEFLQGLPLLSSSSSPRLCRPPSEC